MKKWLIFSCVLFTSSSLFAQADPPLLEEYSFHIGDSPGVEFSFHDSSLGPGGAQLRIQLSPAQKAAYRVKLEVFRHLPPGVIAFALLLERVEISFQDASGSTIRSIVLDKVLGESGIFIIGDSSDGYFQRTVTADGLGAVRQVSLKLFGNYE